VKTVKCRKSVYNASYLLQRSPSQQLLHLIDDGKCWHMYVAACICAARGGESDLLVACHTRHKYVSVAPASVRNDRLHSLAQLVVCRVIVCLQGGDSMVC
jgi:hypothetical protein